MKEVRIYSGLAGKDYTFPAGSIQTVTDEKAEELTRKGLAELIGEAKNTASRKAATRRTATKPSATVQKPLPAETTDSKGTTGGTADATPPQRKPTGKKRGRKPKNSNQ